MARKVPYGPQPWIMWLYNAIAGYMIVKGVMHIVLDAQTMASLPKPLPASVTRYFYFLFALALFQMSLGLGLILKWDWARAVVRVFCWIAIFFDALGLFGSSMGAVVFGTSGIAVRMFFGILDIVAWGTLLWLLSETD